MITKKTVYFIIFYLILKTILFSDDYNIDILPQWIERIEIPQYEINPGDIINGEYYLLSDMQVQTSPRAFYNHYAILLDNSTGLENNSQISIDFDPSYEKLTIHAIQIIRDGKTIDKLDNAIRSVIQKENELEKLIYNGTRSFYAILSDIRAGDILEVAYSIKEENPLFSPYSDRFYTQWAVPVNYVYRRISTENNIPLNIKYNGIEKEPQILHEGREFIWEFNNLPAVYYDENVPYWYDAHNYIEVSQYSSWQQVSSMVTDYYQDLKLSEDQAQYIYSLYPEITENSSTEKIIETLLNAVQEDIRYMGIEIGRGSYIPTQPYDVYTRRFGDCKDKSLLMSELLNYKGIEAYPVLVHNSLGKELINALPSPYQFNHVIVKILHNNKTYWFDPTNTFQEGSLDNLSEASYGYGLVLSESSKGLEKILPAFSGSNTIINETFSLPEDISESGSYIIETIYLNEDADYMRSYLENTPKNTVAEELSDYMETYYEGLTASEVFQFSDDKIQNRIVLEEYYEIPQIWQYSTEENRYQFIYSPYEIYNYTTTLEDLDRTMPYSLRYPIKIEQNVKIGLPEEWSIKAINDLVETEDFFYRRSTEYNSREISISYIYEALKDSVNADKIEDYNENLISIGQSIDYAIYWDHGKEDSGELSNSSGDIKILLIPLVVLAYLTIRFLRRKKTIDQIH